MKEIPKLYVDEEECCGCFACEQICPKKAIKMVEDKMGFYYPKINSEKCINCKNCLKVCPLKNNQFNN